MICTVNNIIESLSNSEGRFRTLDGLVPDNARIENPVVSYSGALVCFRVFYRDQPYLLKCFLNPPPGSDAALRRVSAYLEGVRESWIVDYRYLGDEMLVFDDRGTCRSIDVVLMEYPEGMLLDSLLADAADRQDTQAVDGLMRVFCRTVSRLLASDMVHGNLKPSNILVTAEGELKFLNYEYMWVPGMPDTDPDGDNIAAANLALGLRVLSSDPVSFRLLNGNSVFRLPVLRSSLLPLFTELADASGCEPMRRLVRLLQASNYCLRDKHALISILEALADDPAAIAPALTRRLFSRLAVAEAGSELSQPALSGAYDWVGPVSEALCCVERSGRWGYVDTHNRGVIPLYYDWADDFRECRAVVCFDGAFALIDKEGAEILPAIYESIDWNGEYGLAAAALEGKMGLFDRNGREVVPFVYDWIGPVGPLILVRRDNLCGYIRSDGSLAIPLCFEDAFDFSSDGTALVISDGREYLIDASGKEVLEKESVPV